ncbi:hypothetical protein EAG_16320 [Camponotus floridanus]|uniref:Uncharacterized protein n=1 Tax=Camponotus floridanus TaxID=104421 RepID=E2A6K7_CAMFO|nr:hypothetical protein EAG_16320 [Camponotus floridanus]
MKFFERPKCLTEAIAPVITLDRLMGLRVFEYPRGQPRPLLSLIYLLLLYCLYYSGSWYLGEEYYLIVKLMKLEYFLYKVLNYITVAMIIVKLLLGWWYTKGNKTVEIIYSIYGCDEASGVQEEIQQFGIQILQSPVRFFAYGISLDNHVLTMGNKTIEIIYSIYGCDEASGVQEEIQQFSIQILQSPVIFFAYGISLDNHVLTTRFNACYKRIFEIDETLRQLGLMIHQFGIQILQSPVRFFAYGISLDNHVLTMVCRRMLQLSKMFQPKTMHEMIMPLLVANFALGIGIWTNKRGRILNFAYSFICLVSYCVLMRYSIEYIYIYYTQKSNQFGLMTFRAMFYANMCSTLFLVPSGWLRKKYMKMALMRIMMCEKTMEQMGIQKNYRKLYLNQLYALVFIVLTFIIFIIISYDGMFVKDTPMHVKIVLMLAINYPIALLYVSDVSFLQWIRYAKLRFEQLNNLLQRMLTTTPDSPQHKRVLKMKDEWNKTSTSVTQQDRRSEENTNTMRAVK